jgi:GTP-sensing pleiotropic transcriptional regulator CodY
LSSYHHLKIVLVAEKSLSPIRMNHFIVSEYPNVLATEKNKKKNKENILKIFIWKKDHISDSIFLRRILNNNN